MSAAQHFNGSFFFVQCSFINLSFFVADVKTLSYTVVNPESSDVRRHRRTPNHRFSNEQVGYRTPNSRFSNNEVGFLFYLLASAFCLAALVTGDSTLETY